MKVDLAQCINKGMQRDYSMDKASQEFAYENKNIRITTTGNNSFLSVSNEKSTILMHMNIELPDSKLAYYNLNITRSDDGAFNGIGSISQASILFSKPLAMDASFNLHITTGFLDNEKKDITLFVKKGQQEVNLEKYINDPIIGKVLSLRIWEDSNSVVFPVWIDHENPPYASNIGTVLGSTTIGNKVVIFNKYDDGTDAIIVGEPDSEYNNFNCTYLYQGDLNFNIDNPIECITSYEADDIQKVYWVDGVNQPRVINIINQNDAGEDIRYPRNTSFDFVPPIPSNIDVTIEKRHDGAGVFPSGIIQYYITYYKKFGPETNSVYQSPLYYISPSDRGGQADETQTCSFKLTITPKSNEFDYVRVYSLIRTSYNAEPIVSIVGDINIKSSDNLKTVTITDTNVNNIPVASTDIMFLGGNTITASTIEQKDNTLFLGNISSKKEDIVSQIKSLTNKGTLQFCIKRSFVESSNNQYYPYAPEMDSSSINKTTFKYLEWYRFGLQVQLPTGEWSSTVHLGDFQNTILPDQYVEGVPIYPPIDLELIDEDSDEPTTKQEQYLTGIQFEMSSELIEILANNSISNWRLVVAQHDANTRTVKAQGLVLPTIFNLEQRSKGTCYASPLWTLNTCLYGKHLMNIDPSGSVVPTTPREEINIDLNAHSHINYANNNYDISKGKLTQLSSVVDYVSEETSTGDSYYLSHIQPIIKISRVYSVGLDYYYTTIKLGIKNFDDPNTEIFGYINYSAMNLTKFDTTLYGNRRKTLKTISEYLRMITWDEFLRKKTQDKFVYQFKSDDGNLIVNLSDITGCTKGNKVFNPGEIPSGDELRDDYGVKPANDVTITLSTYIRKATTTFESELIKTYSNDYFLDANTCNFLSPDLENVQGSTKFRIIGSADITNSISDYEIKVKDNVLDGVYYTYAKHILNNYKSSTTENSEVFNTGIKSFPLWPFNNKLYNINYWHPGGPIIKNVVKENGANVDKFYFDLESKTFANMWVLGNNSYFNTVDYGLAKEYTKLDNSSSIINGGIYKADYENLLVSKSDKNFAIPDSNEGVNETTPIEVIASYIDNKDIALIDRKPSTTTVKHSTASHGVFQLGKAHNLPNILPNYGNNILGNATIYNESYPLGKVNINNIWSAIDTELYNEFTPDISKYLNINFTNAKLSLTQEGDDVVLNLTHNLHDLNIKISRINSIFYVNKEDGERIKFGGYISLRYNTISGVYNSILEDIEYNVEDNIYSHNEVLLLISSEITEYYNKPVGILLSGIHKSENSNEFNVNRLEILNRDSLHKCVLKIKDAEYILDEIGNYSALAVPSLTYYSKIIPTSSKLHIGEFYVDYDKNSFMGGNGDNAIELNTFIPISGDYPQITKDGTVTGYGLEGDTYYQRWDYLRIYPTSDTDVNKPIDALSMMVETYKNLDGDYRKLRGRLDTINLTVNNTNTTINEVYSQPNNYITSTVLDEKFDDSTHPTMYTWSLTKQPLAEVDNWTRINLISANKLDGDKGNLNKIKRWNNSLFAFQDKAIAIINFNQQTTLSTSNGVPVEIANSGKVSGHYYLTTTQGCKNKWSITDSPYGLYFIDSYNKSINVLGDGIKSLSSYHLFDDWIRENECGASWLPANATGFKSFYDPIHKEVYFINKETALCYNEILGQFTSFYDYQNTNTMVNIGNHIYSIYDDANDHTSGPKIYLMFEGNDYCKLYGTQRDYYMTYKVNKDPFIDKTWTNIEYRADIFNNGNTSKDNANKIATETFDTLKVWNEYQSGTSNLMEGKYPNAKAKFRVWRADIPRDTREGRGLNRIRNPWVMLELKKSSNTHKRMEFHDLLVKYLS